MFSRKLSDDSKATWASCSRSFFSQALVHGSRDVPVTRLSWSWTKTFDRSNALNRRHLVHHFLSIYSHLLTSISGWWFGTGLLFSISWEFHHPNWRTPSFFSGVAKNHQAVEKSPPRSWLFGGLCEASSRYTKLIETWNILDTVGCPVVKLGRHGLLP